MAFDIIIFENSRIGAEMTKDIMKDRRVTDKRYRSLRVSFNEIKGLPVNRQF